MSCPYCTPMRDGETGESLEFCKEFAYVYEEWHNTLIRTCLIQDKDDGTWLRQVLMAGNWPERGTVLSHPLVVSFEAPPYCPHCGRKLGGE